MTSTGSFDSASAGTTAVLSKLPVTLDTQGRVRVSKEQRRVILAEFARSGVSAARFAQRAGLKYSTFAGWVQRYRRTKRPGPKPPVRLLEAVVTPSPSTPVLRVHLPGGARLEFCDVSQVPLVAALVCALEKPC